MEYNWTRLNVKLLAGCILLFWIGIILVSSQRRSCTLYKILYWASGAPNGIYWCANCRPTWCGWPELCSYWLTQNRLYVWLVAHNISLHCYERLAGSPVTKLIRIHKLSSWFLHLPERRCFISTKNQRCLRKTVNFRQHFRNLSRKTVPLTAVCKNRNKYVLYIFKIIIFLDFQNLQNLCTPLLLSQAAIGSGGRSLHMEIALGRHQTVEFLVYSF